MSDRATGLGRLRAVLEGDAREPLALPARSCEEARLFWSERAAGERAAIPAFSQALLAMVRESASTDAMAAIAAIIGDEVRHAELCTEVADAFGGAVAVPAHDDDISLGAGAPLPMWLVGNGCISETVSLALLSERARTTPDAALAAVWRSIARDEALHARTCWELAAAVLPTLPTADRARVARFAEAVFAAVQKTFSTVGLAPATRREARRIRQVTADRGLGALAPDVADALVATRLDDIRERLETLGVRARVV